MRHAGWITLLTLLVTAASAVHGTGVDEYLALRRKLGYDPRATYASVSTNLTASAGRYFELAGSVTGTVQRADAALFMLTLDDRSFVLLPSPQGDAGLVADTNRPRLRVLVHVLPGAAGNVPDLEPVAVAIDSEVTAREQAAARQAAADEQRRRDREQAAAAARASAPTPVGRGLALRPIGGAISELARRHLSLEAQSIYPLYCRFIASWNKKLDTATVDQITVSLLYFAQKHRVDPRLVVSLIIAESDFDPASTSHAGAMGLGQIMPDEARDHKLSNPYDPIQNVRATVNMMRMKLDMYRESGLPQGQLSWRQIALAMAAYNAGSGAVRKYGGVPPYRETQGYVRRVLQTYQKLCGMKG